MSILTGIDPGITNIGLAKIDTDSMTVLETKVLKWEGSYTKLLHRFTEELDGSDFVSIEKPFFTGRTLTSNVKTLEIIGLIKLASEYLGIETAEYSPKNIKKVFTGDGNASKKDIKDTVRFKFDRITRTSHEADAVAIAYTHYVKSCS